MAKISLINEVPLELLKSFLKIEEEGFSLSIKVKPNSSKEKLSVSAEGELLLSVRGAALEGAANARVVELLSELLVVPKSKIQIISGHKSRLKRLLFRTQPLR